MKPVTDCANAEAVRLRQQLAERETQVTLLRNAIEMSWSKKYVNGIEAKRLSEEALAATEPKEN
jgi:hypothetical protein